MNVISLGDETTVRLAMFLLVFLALAITERIWPCRQHGLWVHRWLNNLSLSVINTLCLRLLTPWSATMFALLIVDERASVVAMHEWPFWASVIAFVLLFDLTIYMQHRLFHIIGPLWHFHRVHHTDLEYDVTTGMRFHPISIMISMAIKLLLVLLLGPLPVAVLIAEVLLNATSMFNHSNIRLPPRLEKALRYVIVTPDMHRIHHSTLTGEHGANFGFNFPWWDRLFGSYLENPSVSHADMSIGIDGYGVDWSVRLDRLLWQPMRRDDGTEQE